MVVISFLLVIIAAVTLIVGLFQDGIEWIWASIASCVLAMVFLGIGVLQRRSTPTASLTGDDDEDEYSPDAISSLVGADEDDEAEAAPEEPEVAVVPKRTAGEPTRDDQPERDDDETTIVPRVSADDRAAAEPAEAAPRTTGEAARERLSQIDGLGATKVDALLDHFGSLEAVVMASTEELTAVNGIGASTAQRVKGGLAGGRPARKKTAKKSARKATAKKTAKKRTAKKTAKKATAKKTAKKATAKKTAKKRTAKKATRGAAARDRLTGISGVSPARADALLDRFGSLEAVASASKDDLTEVKGIGASIAERISAEL